MYGIKRTQPVFHLKNFAGMQSRFACYSAITYFAKFEKIFVDSIWGLLYNVKYAIMVCYAFLSII